jgi:dynein heavy chain
MYTKQSLDLLQGLINKDKPPTADVLGRLYVFALMWSVGALLELFDRKKLEDFIMEKKNLDFPPIKGEETMFEYVVNIETGQWQHWSHRVPEYIYAKDSIPEYSSILVPNVDNVRTDFLIDTIAKQEKSVLLIGEQVIKIFLFKKEIVTLFVFRVLQKQLLLKVIVQNMILKFNHLKVSIFQVQLLQQWFNEQLKVMLINVLVLLMVHPVERK